MNLLKETLALTVLNTGNFSKSLETAASIITNIQSGARGVIEKGGGDALKILSNPISQLSNNVELLSKQIKGPTAQASKVQIESATPIKIELGNSFNLSSVVQLELGKLVSNVIDEKIKEGIKTEMSNRGYSR